MAYRRILRGWGLLGGLFLLGVSSVGRAEPARVAVVVDGPEGRAEEVESAVRHTLEAAGHSVLDRSTVRVEFPLDDGAAETLRKKLDLARLVAITLKKQSPSIYGVTVRAVDASGIARRFGDGKRASLGDDVAAIVAELPALPPPPAPPKPNSPVAAAEPAAPVADAPAAAAVAPASGQVDPLPPGSPPPEDPVARPKSQKRKHEYGLLIGGAVAFLIPYIATVTLAAYYNDYSPNASRAGYLPLAGPFLGRDKMNDKDLRDGYGPALIAVGVLQVVTFNMLLAGLVYCIVGVKKEAPPRSASMPFQIRPLLSASLDGGQVGALVRW